MIKTRPKTPAWLTRFGSRLANRQIVFAFAVLVILEAKLVHIHSHRFAVASDRLLTYFGSLFAQDILLLVLIRLLLDHWVPRASLPYYLSTAVTGVFIFYNVLLAAASVSFYLVAGSEIHWGNISLVSDPTSRAIVLSGLATFVLVVSVSLFFSWLLQNICYRIFGWAADMVNFPLAWAGSRLSHVWKSRIGYGRIPQLGAADGPDSRYSDGNDESDSESLVDFGNSETVYSRLSAGIHKSSGISVQPSIVKRVVHGMPYVIWCLFLVALGVLSLERPNDRSLVFLSWTVGVLPFVDIASTSPLLDHLPSHYGVGIQHQWDDRSALAEPPTFNWLPKGKPLAGFEDWYTPHELHYNAAADPLKTTNLDEPLRESLRDKLQDVPIKHVILFLLESTRNDVFPIKKDGAVWNRFQDSYPDHKIPEKAVERLSTLTPTANYVTGDYDDGFEHQEKPKRGGARFTNAHTASTYTLKSMVGTICGITPLIADFNLDYKRHIYQPCLPQIFDAMNKATDTDTAEASSKWKSYFYQAATLHYDNHDKLMAAMGYPKENTIDRDWLRSEDATHGPATLKDINYFAFEEDPLEDYIRDIFVNANETNDRVFLTHITSTSHHAYGLPASQTATPFGQKEAAELSDYANAEGYDDGWIRKVLNLLDEQGVANETLVIFLGDHGTSLVENGKPASYYNPSIGADHVPLVLSHPLLPAFDVHEAVSSTQVLPTILDLLLETGSLANSSRQAAEDLIQNYEGQSLLRPSQPNSQGQWQFVVVNPGRAMLGVRDARHPERHLVVPLINNVEWRLSDIATDPLEKNGVQAFDFISFLQSVEAKFGREWAEWVEEGAFVARWHVQDNGKRWRYERNLRVGEKKNQ
ncbi:alkaline-phosphatase-like protein [Dactylonectria estremocensis]|uniref:Alkaline-phosphatase-like protein n=1 Tax=Dactylonectria estremocensis TaxID=1079267 RepID=A0A9P9J568_9HYPO|nr:alkaline-phosphatase-like protein [Dactylonectria estremocensis]